MSPIVDEHGKAVPHTPEFITQLFDEELAKLIANPGKDLGTARDLPPGAPAERGPGQERRV